VSAGPYNLVEFDQASKQATLVINENYAGNFEGQKPSVPKIVITKAEDATWADALKTGAFNFYDTMTDGTEINTAMDIIEDEANKEALGYGFKYSQFDRPGYGKLMFQSDFGPTQFLAVRHAIAHLLDRNEFANTFCAGWGGVVNGPYGTAMWMYKEAEEWLDENLDNYAYNPEKAVELLVEDGWVYAEDGSDYVEGIRYKKVTDEEAGTYPHVVTLEDGTKLMGLIIEWSSSEGNSVSDLLSVMLANGDQTAAAGVKINQNVMTFSELLNYMYRDASQGDKYGIPTYCMYNLASNFQPEYDQSYSFTLDPAMVEQGYNTDFIFDEELDKLSMDMVYGIESGDDEGYLEVWKQFIQRWNYLLPEVPLYSNIYITVYPDWLENYTQDSYWDFNQAILYATIAE
jgi:peptide/nickel transport system substrate-binding protein